MKNAQLVGLGALLSLVAACSVHSTGTDTSTTEKNALNVTGKLDGGSSKDDGGAVAECTPLTSSGGSANPASVYCGQLGYTSDPTNGNCVFPDGTTCEEFAFYRGECGQAHSFCNLHGGSLSTKTEDMGTWTATYAVCTLPDGKQCQAEAFALSCICE
jgi:putative hemolysin